MPGKPNSGYFEKIFGLIKSENMGYQSIWLDELKKNIILFLNLDNSFVRHAQKTDQFKSVELSWPENEVF